MARVLAAIVLVVAVFPCHVRVQAGRATWKSIDIQCPLGRITLERAL